MELWHLLCWIVAFCCSLASCCWRSALSASLSLESSSEGSIVASREIKDGYREEKVRDKRRIRRDSSEVMNVAVHLGKTLCAAKSKAVRPGTKMTRNRGAYLRLKCACTCALFLIVAFCFWYRTYCTLYFSVLACSSRSALVLSSSSTQYNKNQLNRHHASRPHSPQSQTPTSRLRRHRRYPAGV